MGCMTKPLIESSVAFPVFFRLIISNCFTTFSTKEEIMEWVVEILVLFMKKTIVDLVF